MMNEPIEEFRETTLPDRASAAAPQEAFQGMIADLKASMTRDFTCVDDQRNPVAMDLDRLGIRAIQQVVSFYSRFPARIVDFLKAARGIARENGWRSIDIELTRNIGEELGTESPKPHYDHLVSGTLSALGFNVEDPRWGESLSTARFLERMQEITHDSSEPCRALGGIYAAECSAVKELLIVKELLNKISRSQRGTDLPEASELGVFLASHIDNWEIGHEDKLASAASDYVTSEEARAQFSQGFRAVLGIMDEWWNGVHAEVQTNS